MQVNEVMKRDGKMVRIGLRLNRHLIIILSPPNRHPIAQPSQEESILDKSREEYNNTPTPPKGGRRGKKSELKEINSKARFLFE